MIHRNTAYYRNRIIASGLAGALLIISQLRILVIPLFVIQRYLILAHKPKAMHIQFVNWKKMSDDSKTKTLKRYQGLAIINKSLLFPALITLYLALLLIDQTKLRNLQIQTRYLALDQSYILFLVIMSGLGTVYENPKLEQYTKSIDSMNYHWAYIALSSALSLLGTYIISLQVVELEIIGHIISIIAGILIFLVGMMLLEEEDEIET